MKNVRRDVRAEPLDSLDRELLFWPLSELIRISDVFLPSRLVDGVSLATYQEAIRFDIKGGSEA